MTEQQKQAARTAAIEAAKTSKHVPGTDPVTGEFWDGHS